MVDNTTELLSLIVKAMSKEGIEVTNVKLYEQAVELNNEVKVRISNGGYIIHKINERDVISCALEKSMVVKVLELLTENDWLPGDKIESHGEWFTLVIQESEYYKPGNEYYRLLDKDYYLSDIIELEYLKKNYINRSLEDRLK